MRIILFITSLLINVCLHADTTHKEVFDFKKSFFHVLIYSDGMLSGLGHDHVISSKKSQGHYTIDSSSKVEAHLKLDVTGFMIDQKTDRALYPNLANADQPSADDIIGTRDNMLSNDVLSAKQHPHIFVYAHGNIKEGMLTVRMTLRNKTASTQSRVKAMCINNRITAKGEFSFSHSDFGLEPFSALFGSIKVADQLDFHFQTVTNQQC